MVRTSISLILRIPGPQQKAVGGYGGVKDTKMISNLDIHIIQ